MHILPNDTPHAFLYRKLIMEEWGEGFAQRIATLTADLDLASPLMDIATNPQFYTHNRAEADKIAFRAAYILESLFFNFPETFLPLYTRFFTSFNHAHNGSVKRHWSKIAMHLIQQSKFAPNTEQAELIAQACAEWVVDTKVRVAVKIYAIETLFQLKKHVDWVPELMPDLLNAFTHDGTPAVWATLRKWKRKGQVP